MSKTVSPWLVKKWYVVCYKAGERGPCKTKVVTASHEGRAKQIATEIVQETCGWTPKFFKIRRTVPGEWACEACSEAIRRGEVCPACRKELDSQ